MTLSASTSLGKGGYRRDIDGLRAVAVLAVVLYHLDAYRIPGGFIGVDIFFVISGYLISGILARDMDAGRFTLAGFYERRVRRIAPALLVMLAFASALAAYLFLPTDLISYAYSLLAATFSYSNLFFWHIGNYFADNFSWMLLHTWSLSVEEQFYLVFPLCLLLLKKYPRRLRPALVILAVVSFAFSTWLVGRDPTAAFYNPLARAWELLIGCLLGIGIGWSPRSRILNELLAATGLLMIFAGIVFYSKYTVFPGPTALLPCVGCGLLLWTGERENTYAGKLLSTRPFVGVGLISYSMYLWHWPVIIAGRFDVIPGVASHGVAKLLLLLASFILGYLSWRFVEQPFRHNKARSHGRRNIFTAAAAGAITITAVALFFVAKQGIPARFPPQAIAIASWLSKPQQLTEFNAIVVERHLSSWSVEDRAVLDPARPNYLLLGDSHAAALRPGLAAQLKGINLLLAVQPSCNPVVGAYDNSACGQMNRYIYEQMFQKHKIDGVILTHRWTNAAEIEALGPTVAWFQEHHIELLIVGPVQEYEGPLPLLLAFAIRQNRPNLAERHLDLKYKQLDLLMRQKTADWKVPYVSIRQTFCPNDHCIEYIDPGHRIPTYYDGGHVTQPAAESAARQWISQGFLPFKQDPTQIASATATQQKRP